MGHRPRRHRVRATPPPCHDRPSYLPVQAGRAWCMRALGPKASLCPSSTPHGFLPCSSPSPTRLGSPSASARRTRCCGLWWDQWRGTVRGAVHRIRRRTPAVRAAGLLPAGCREPAGLHRQQHRTPPRLGRGLARLSTPEVVSRPGSLPLWWPATATTSCPGHEVHALTRAPAVPPRPGRLRAGTVPGQDEGRGTHGGPLDAPGARDVGWADLPRRTRAVRVRRYLSMSAASTR